jgi:hypothetical protein
LADLARNFDAKVFDQVPFLLADGSNTHTMDPERFRGEVTGVEATDEGLDVLLELTPDAADLVRKNPKLGVSARIVEGLTQADGTRHSRVLQHVLGTLDPRVTGMASWEEVALAEEVGETVDFTSREVNMVPEGTGTETPPTPTATPPTPTGTVTDDEARAAEIELARVAAEEDDRERANEIELLRTNSVTNQGRIEQLEMDLARERFDRDAAAYVDAGVPPVMVNLARPLLELPAAPVIELSNAENIDVGQVVRGILDEAKGFVELQREQGHSFRRESEKEEADALLEAWESNGKMGGKR